MRPLIKSVTMLMAGFVILTFKAHALALVDITSDQDNIKTVLYLGVDANKDITKFGIRWVEDNELKKKEFIARNSANEIVVKEQGNHEVIKLISDNFSSHNGGNIDVDFLNNGITGSRDSRSLNLVREGDSWALQKNGKKVQNMHFISKTVFGKAIGIKDVVIK